MNHSRAKIAYFIFEGNSEKVIFADSNLSSELFRIMVNVLLVHLWKFRLFFSHDEFLFLQTLYIQIAIQKKKSKSHEWNSNIVWVFFVNERKDSKNLLFCKMHKKLRLFSHRWLGSDNWSGKKVKLSGRFYLWYQKSRYIIYWFDRIKKKIVRYIVLYLVAPFFISKNCPDFSGSFTNSRGLSCIFGYSFHSFRSW